MGTGATRRGSRDPAGKPDPDAPAVPEPYVAPAELVRAVNLAIFLRRPLLLEGEAGCGKTRLASAVAYELDLPFFTWPVRSTSKAQEGLYTYDAILRLHDVQLLKREGPGEASTDVEGHDPRARRTTGDSARSGGRSRRGAAPRSS